MGNTELSITGDLIRLDDSTGCYSEETGAVSAFLECDVAYQKMTNASGRVPIQTQRSHTWFHPSVTIPTSLFWRTKDRTDTSHNSDVLFLHWLVEYSDHPPRSDFAV
jgi:hypothetical protein